MINLILHKRMHDVRVELETWRLNDFYFENFIFEQSFYVLSHGSSMFSFLLIKYRDEAALIIETAKAIVDPVSWPFFNSKWAWIKFVLLLNRLSLIRSAWEGAIYLYLAFLRLVRLALEIRLDSLISYYVSFLRIFWKLYPSSSSFILSKFII